MFSQNIWVLFSDYFVAFACLLHSLVSTHQAVVNFKRFPGHQILKHKKKSFFFFFTLVFKRTYMYQPSNQEYFISVLYLNIWLCILKNQIKFECRFFFYHSSMASWTLLDKISCGNPFLHDRVANLTHIEHKIIIDN